MQLDSQSGYNLLNQLKGALRGARYEIFCLLDRLSFEGLTETILQLKLPMLVLLEIKYGEEYGEVAYNHVIGISPYRVGDGSGAQY